METVLRSLDSQYVSPDFDPTAPPAAIEGDLDTTAVARYDVRVKQRAYELVLFTSKSLSEIAADLAVPQAVVATWSRKGGWTLRKQELERELTRSTESRYAEYLRTHLLPELQAQLETSQDMQRLVRQELQTLEESHKQSGKPIDTMVLRRLAETLAHAANLSCRALGLVEQAAKGEESSGLGSEERGPRSRGGAKTPLVMVNVMPALPVGVTTP